MILKKDDPASLDHLHDIVLPEPVSWFPPASGWVLLAILIISIALLMLVRSLVIWRMNAYRRRALYELNGLYKNTDKSNLAIFREAAEILKRTAMAQTKRSNIAGLTQVSWVNWLNQHGGGVKFENNLAMLFEETLYKPDSTDLPQNTLDEAINTIKSWIKYHQIVPQDSTRGN